MSDIRKKWKALVHKVGYLKFELEERKEKLERFESEVTKKMSEKDPAEAVNEPVTERGMDQYEQPDKVKEPISEEPGQESDVAEPEKIIEATADKTGIPGFKKLWRQIALRAHPDRAGGDEDLVRLYRKAQEAWNRGEVEVILDVALELEIQVSEPTEEMLEILEKRALGMQQEISKCEGNVLWVWGHSEENKQNFIIDELLKIRRTRRGL